MQIYLVRHGIAEDCSREITDFNRRLTAAGENLATVVARDLGKMLLPIPTVIVHSPLLRALETAVILHHSFAPFARLEPSESLNSEPDVIRAMALIAKYAELHRTVMFVSHEPLLSSLGSAILTGNANPVIEMEKNSVALFKLTNIEVPRVRGYLELLLPASIRKIETGAADS